MNRPPTDPAREFPVPDERAENAARARQRDLTKPPGSLGRLEDLACWFAGRLSRPIPDMPRCEIFVFAADHGVAAQGVSAFPQAVTASMLANFAQGGAAINVLARLHDCRIEVVDVGVAAPDGPPAGIRNERIRPGTRDLTQTAALNLGEVAAALEVGRKCAREAIRRGAGLLIAGDMGIANTTAAACLISALTNTPPASVIGRGTGVDDAGLARKLAAVITGLERLARYAPEIIGPQRALRTLAELGGLEIAAMAGFYLEGARNAVPLLLDGYISSAAALCAVAIEPATRQWMLASHKSAEPGHAIALTALDMTPLVDLGMRLGEGTGAVLSLPVIRAALALHKQMATFSEAGVPDKA